MSLLSIVRFLRVLRGDRRRASHLQRGRKPTKALPPSPN